MDTKNDKNIKMDSVEISVVETSKIKEKETEKLVETKIDFSDFAKIDLRVGQIKSADKVAGSEKLMKLTVDLGEKENRQILAGIAPYYTPEELLERKAIFVANLKPRKMMGLESNGMILAGKNEPAETTELRTEINQNLPLLALLSPDKDIPAGTKIG